MKVIYYSDEFASQQTGGGIHSREFAGAFRELPGVERLEIFNVMETTSTFNDAVQNVRSILPHWNFTRYLSPWRARFRTYPGLRKVIYSGTFDWIILRTGLTLSLIRKIKKDFPALKICLEVNSSIFNESYDDMPSIHLLRRIEAREFEFGDLITAVSSRLKAYLIHEGVSEAKIIVNPNGVSPSLFQRRASADYIGLRQNLGIPEDAFVLGYCGGMEPFRHLADVVECFANLRQNTFNDIFFLLIGDGADRRRIESVIKSREGVLSKSFKWLGWQQHEDIPRLMGLFDLALFPFSNPYGSPQKLFEYLALGLPVIGPDLPSVREIFQDNVHMLLVSQSKESLKQAIVTLKKDPELRNRLGSEGQRLVLEKYTWEENAKRVLQALQERSE